MERVQTREGWGDLTFTGARRDKDDTGVVSGSVHIIRQFIKRFNYFIHHLGLPTQETSIFPVLYPRAETVKDRHTETRSMH